MADESSLRSDPRDGHERAVRDAGRSASALVAGAAPAGAGLRVFVVHASEDAWFVDGFLVPALSLPAQSVLVSSRLDPGTLMVEELARGALSPLTVVVVSPALLSSPWALFASLLATHQNIDATGEDHTTLVPVILADCELPLVPRPRAPAWC